MRVSFHLNRVRNRETDDDEEQDPLIARGINPSLFLWTFIIGGLLFVSSFFILFFNEIFNVTTNRRASFIEQHAVAVPADPVSRANDGKLVVVSGPVRTDLSVSDGFVSVSDALVLRRHVEMFQWVEHIRHSGKSSSASYERKWSSFLHNSSGFRRRKGHVNPGRFPVNEETIAVPSAKMGGFSLKKDDLELLEGGQPLASDVPIKGYIYSGGYYYAATGRSPDIGDIRLSYSYIPSGGVFTFVGRQTGNDALTPMPMKEGSLFLTYAGSLKTDDVLDKLGRHGTLRLNLWRIGGVLLMLAGLKLIVRQVMTGLSLSPKTERFVGIVSDKDLLWLAGALVSGAVSFAWLFCNRGLLIYALLVCAVCSFVFKNKFRENKALLASGETGKTPTTKHIEEVLL